MSAAGTVSPPARPASRRRLPIALYPIGLAMSAPLLLYVSISLSPFSIGRAVLIAGSIGLLATLLATQLTRDKDRGGLVAGLAVLAIVGGAWPPMVLPIIALMGIVTLDARRPPERRLRIRWDFIGRVAAAAVTILLLALGIKAVQEGRLADTAYDLAQEARVPWSSAQSVSAASGDHPDIYLVLLDGYLRPDKQAELFGGDASGFVAELETRGFDVAARSRSNYIVTKHSLVSMLNMAHIIDVAAEDRRGAQPDFDVRYLVNEATAVIAARSAGYEIVGISAGWEELALRQADLTVDPGVLNDIEYTILFRTIVRPILDNLAPSLVGDAWRSRVAGTFEALAGVAESPSPRPRLVFTHVPSPHSPFVFGPNGEPLRGFRMEQIHDSMWPHAKGAPGYGPVYLGQIRHIDRLTLAAIDRILEADQDAVVVIFSDHGSAAGFDPSDLRRTDLDERTANLVAVRSPGHPDLVPEDATLINVLPPILNAYLGTNFRRSADDIYASTGSGPFDLTPSSLPLD